MTQVWFGSDFHFGHKNIAKFRTEVLSEEENRNRIINDWKELVGKKDKVFLLGDIAFTMDVVGIFKELNGEKVLVRGNHDELDTQVYLKYFSSVYGLRKYKEFWLSHPPIHPSELRNRVNLHGHVHYATVQDSRYFNCCPENLWKLTGKSLISLDQIRRIMETK